VSQFLNAPIRKGEVSRQRITIGELADGSPIAIPVVTIGGAADGPTLYLQGGLHGDESTGIEICQRAVAAIDPARLAGQVVAVPVANVPAYLTRTRGFLHEERWLIDINRVFPGRAGGLLTERIANVLFEQFIKAADFSLDLHSALDGCDIVPFVYIDPDDDQNGTLAKRESYGTAFGTPFIYRKKRGAKLGTSDLSNSLSAQADLQGVHSLTAEMGESRRSSADFVPIGVRGVHNVLCAMGMVDGAPTKTPDQRTFTGFDVVHATRGGCLRVVVELGQEVTSGQLVAEVVDVYGQVVERIEAPRDGFALRLMRLASVNTGAEIAWVAS
jgi:uncharacterized protein